MPNYKLMYLTLFNAVTDSITNLQNAQCETEKLAIQKEDIPLCIAPKQNEEDL